MGELCDESVIRTMFLSLLRRCDAAAPAPVVPGLRAELFVDV